MNHDHSSNGGTTSHMLLMLLCCLIPIGLIAAVAIFGISLGALTPYLPFAIVLLCPLLMFFMMRGMGHEPDATEIRNVQTTRDESKNISRIAPSGATRDHESHH